jgi:hypothetical protein
VQRTRAQELSGETSSGRMNTVSAWSAPTLSHELFDAQMMRQLSGGAGWQLASGPEGRSSEGGSKGGRSLTVIVNLAMFLASASPRETDGAL